MDTIALEVEELSVNYDKTPVLWDLNFSIPAEVLVAIVGPNGAGKSTLLKAILGIIPSLSGRAKFFGVPLKEARRRVAYVPQRSSVDWDFPVTVFDVVLMGVYGKLGMFMRPRAAERLAAEQALEIVGMSGFAERQISQLSGGQQQRVFLARALMQEADMYLMDEPFAGVDMASEQAILEVFGRLKAKGKTLVVVHHDLSTVERTFDFAILLNTCLIACGAVADVFTPENLKRAYGKNTALLDEAAKLVYDKSAGLEP